jgi:hypothetical protein
MEARVGEGLRTEGEAADGWDRVRRRRGWCTRTESNGDSPTGAYCGGCGRREEEAAGGGGLGFLGEGEATRLSEKGEGASRGCRVNPARGHAGPTGGCRFDAAARPANGRAWARGEDGGRG